MMPILDANAVRKVLPFLDLILLADNFNAVR